MPQKYNRLIPNQRSGNDLQDVVSGESLSNIGGYSGSNKISNIYLNYNGSNYVNKPRTPNESTRGKMFFNMDLRKP